MSSVKVTNLLHASSANNNLVLGSGGTAQFYNTISVGNATPSSSGAGITFPATQSASSDANTLDDYEEGVWTPTLASGGTGITYTTQAGKYTKIGNLVTFIFLLKMSAVTAAATQIKIGGLPFTIGSGEGGAYVAYISYNTNAGDFYYLFPGNTQILVQTITAANRLGNDAGITLTGYIELAGFYYI